MITKKMEEKFEELKRYFNTKMLKQEESLMKILNNILNDLRKEITKQIQNEVKFQCKYLEYENQRFQPLVFIFQVLTLKFGKCLN